MFDWSLYFTITAAFVTASLILEGLNILVGFFLMRRHAAHQEEIYQKVQTAIKTGDISQLKQMGLNTFHIPPVSGTKTQLDEQPDSTHGQYL